VLLPATFTRTVAAVVAAAAGEPIDAFCARAAEGCGVVLLPATVYDHAAASAGEHFRLGLGRTNFKEALQTLDNWLQQQQHQRQQQQ
jgi:hypothetical protein